MSALTLCSSSVCRQQQQATINAQLQNSRAVQASGVAAAGAMEKVAEQEKLLEHKTREIDQLTVGGRGFWEGCVHGQYTCTMMVWYFTGWSLDLLSWGWVWLIP